MPVLAFERYSDIERKAVNTPTGLERITKLEAEVAALKENVIEIKGTTNVIRDLLVQGRGAIRLVHVVLWIGGALGLGYVFREKAIEFLRWVGN